MHLTVAQASHVAKVFPECRAEMADFLEARAEVVIYKQDECGSDVPPFAIAVAGTAFWIGCCETPEEATALADSLGLKVVEVCR
ncbi:hypothetical protein WI61_06580 [Burkholderia cepacia]|nr:hypothetical protein WI48_02050 [Burkholderia cepacia]KVA54488.1 hypothetical protein WI47_10675 [Burkholderia cepacia]KVA63562.1 hypothetical protein WI49_20685 [Burkholderia cepacia]KVA82889.1 hypothetical protein WI51_24590 [Burkholderia cepacia]KVA85831.1 hypothetical protein WI50_16865 [Burkholderia cepacia]